MSFSLKPHSVAYSSFVFSPPFSFVQCLFRSLSCPVDELASSPDGLRSLSDPCRCVIHRLFQPRYVTARELSAWLLFNQHSYLPSCRFKLLSHSYLHFIFQHFPLRSKEDGHIEPEVMKALRVQGRMSLPVGSWVYVEVHLAFGSNRSSYSYPKPLKANINLLFSGCLG